MKTTAPDFDNLQSQLIGYCIKKMHDRNAAEDIAQETLTRYLANVEKGVVINNIRAWMFQVARNLIIDSSRARRPRCVGFDWGESEADPESLNSGDNEMCLIAGKEVQQSSVLALLPKAMAKLTRDDRSYLDNYYYKQQSFTDLAVNEGVPVSTTKGRMYRARLRLRAQLEAEVVGK